MRYNKVTKGNKLKREDYFFVLQNGQEESMAGPWVRLFGNPFVKKITTRVTWQYDKEFGDFITTASNADFATLSCILGSDHVEHK